MIKITKPATPPDILVTKGRPAIEEICKRYDLGEREFEFDPKIYGSAAVKRELIKAQNKKCCFCEAKVTHIQDGDVEHFRPKKGYMQRKREKMTKPGYYWLVYEWSNLFLACITCNQRSKKNFFPLMDAAKRANSHRDDIAEESPIFIQLDKENPEEFISFNEELAIGIDTISRGNVAIEILDLNRDDLMNRRFEHLQSLKDKLTIIDVATICSPEDKVRAKTHLKKWASDEGEYAGMTRAYLRKVNRGEIEEV